MLAQILLHLPFLPGMDHRACRHMLPQWWVASLRVCPWSVSPDAVGRPVGPIFAGGDLSFLEGCPFFLVAELLCGCGWQSFRESFRPRAMGQPVVLSTAKPPVSQLVA